ncbi:hypothetical protein BDR06DRAFT_103180 [Suillus hirtellus]|nr:hypothetical protein BDR06DRAFT_103180 [Suillus hirtellus]
MIHFILTVSLLFALGTGVSAECVACPNCDYERISIEQGDACINFWTCSGDTITCTYPSVANPGTWNNCSYSASTGWALADGPSEICFSGAGANAKCEAPNNPYNNAIPGCTASYGLINGTNGQLL